MKNAALDNLFKRYYNEALLYVCSFTHNRTVAEDIVAEAYLRAIKSIDEEKDGFKFWLFKVCRNCYFDYYRKSKRVVQISENVADDVSELADRVIQDEEYLALHNALGLLSDKYREVMKLYYFDGFSVKEVAGIMDISVDNVKVLLYRARIKLKEILEGYNEF